MGDPVEKFDKPNTTYILHIKQNENVCFSKRISLILQETLPIIKMVKGV